MAITSQSEGYSGANYWTAKLPSQRIDTRRCKNQNPTPSEESALSDASEEVIQPLPSGTLAETVLWALGLVLPSGHGLSALPTKVTTLPSPSVLPSLMRMLVLTSSIQVLM